MSVQFQEYDVSGMTEFVIPEGIKEIAPDAFKDCTRMKRVVIPQGVRKIGEQAFYGCEQLEEVVLPDGLEEIRKSAFCRCKSLKRLLLPDSVYIIDDSAFKNCEALNEIRFPENMYVIGKMAFAFCVSLKTVRLPSDVREIHYTAFYGCDNLTEIVQSGTLIGDNHAFYELGFSKSVLYNTLTSVMELFPDPICNRDNDEDHKAKYSKRWLEFYNTDKTHLKEELERVVIPRGIREIATDAFIGCEELREVVLPEGLEEIEPYAFANFPDVGCIRLPSSLRRISARAFEKCKIRKVIISEGVEEIAPDAFLNCYVENYIVHPDNPCYSSEDGMLFNKDKTILLAHPCILDYRGVDDDPSLILPEGVEAISEYAFHVCQRFERIWLPSSCHCSMGRFSHRSSYYTSEDGILYNINKTVLLSCPEDKTGDVVVPDTVKQIGAVCFNGFNGCSKLTSVKLPASIKRIVTWAFDGCTCVKEDQLPKDIEWIDGFTEYRYNDVELPDS